MSLVLSILRCPEAVPPETRQVDGGEFRIGRSPNNDWVLADPDRILSKRHCILAFRNGDWQLADLSTNGTYLNHEEDPVGSAAPRFLKDGDRLRLGTYEIEVRIADQARDAAPGVTAAYARHAAFGDDPFGATEPVSLAPEFDLSADERQDGRFTPITAADHSPAHGDAFRPPPLVPNLLPDNWDLDFAPAPPEPAPLAAARPPSGLPQEASSPAAPSPPASDDLFAAFLEGAAMPPAGPETPEAVMRQLGAAFRAMVTGLRQALIARAAIKGEFRIEQTMIRLRGNNPLKFSADDDDALMALLGLGRRTDMPPDVAVADALRDMRLHEIAVMAAMQGAVRALLARLDPDRIRAEAEQAGGALLPAQKKARAFDAFAASHAAIVNALADDFDSLFGKSFARAYEQALREAESRDA